MKTRILYILSNLGIKIVLLCISEDKITVKVVCKANESSRFLLLLLFLLDKKKCVSVKTLRSIFSVAIRDIEI